MSSVVHADRAGTEDSPHDVNARDVLLEEDLQEPFARISRLARRALGVQTAFVSVVDSRRQTFKGFDGLPPDLAAKGAVPARDSLCRLVVATGEQLAVRDGRTDPSVRESAMVVHHHMSAYAGVPLQVADGEVVGSLCVLDPEPRSWTDADMDLLAELAALAVSEMNYRLRLREVMGLESLALRLPEAVERLAEAVRTTASLAEDPSDRRLPRMADVMRARLRPVETLTEDLQQAAAHHRARRPPETVDLDLRDRVRHTVDLVRSSVREEDLLVVVPEEPVRVRVTLPDLDRALSLAVVTALHHLTEGPVSVEVSAAPGGGGRLRVAHAGPPIPVGDLLRVVGAFGTDEEDHPVDVRVGQGVTRARTSRAVAVTTKGATTVDVSLPGPPRARVPQPRAS
jgi:GAF domain-containing protein